jgi:colanic acid biosynthesis glycosyl transferase WcaI
MSNNKIVIATQHYPPDHSTTAGIMREVAGALSTKYQVQVLSGSGDFRSLSPEDPAVISIENRVSSKTALLRRAANEALFVCRIFFALLRRLKRGDIAIGVTAPFVLPYAVALAAWLKRARSVVIMHDLYPEVLVSAGLIKPRSPVALTIRFLNNLMFGQASALVTIGRDADRPLMKYRRMRLSKIRLIPNWCSLVPGYRPSSAENVFRREIAAPFVVGLSGNLGFTHDPDLVFDAALLLEGEADIHFLLSGWGSGFDRLQKRQAESQLKNVTLVKRVEDAQVGELLASADVWVIPYREHIAGMSVPSRFYNLLAIGCAVILASEPETEAALTISENKIGWVVAPGDAAGLANAVRAASKADRKAIGDRAVEISRNFSKEAALAKYVALADELMAVKQTPERRA